MNIKYDKDEMWKNVLNTISNVILSIELKTSKQRL